MNKLLILMSVVLLALSLTVSLQPAGATTAWSAGDVFAGVSNGQYQVYDNTGNFKETISDGLGGFTTGCAFNPALDRLYTTNFSSSRVVVYDNASPHNIVQNIQTAPASSESIVFAANGDFYVGHADGDRDIERYDAAGVLQQTYDVPVSPRGSDWIELAADQKTMFYTSEGRLIRRYDVSGVGAPLADFATLPGFDAAFALRLLPPGDGSGGLLVADLSNVKRLDGAGNVIATYDVTGENSWFSLNLDPDGTSFWAGNFETGKFYKFDIGTAGLDTQLATVDTGVGNFRLFGLCLKGEPTAALQVPAFMTGGGQFDPDGPCDNPKDDKATFGGNASGQPGDASSTKGHFNYLNHCTGLHVNGPVTAIVDVKPDLQQMTFEVAMDGCTAVVTWRDVSEPGRNEDEITLTFTGSGCPNDQASSAVTITKGNLQWHPQGRA